MYIIHENLNALERDRGKGQALLT